MTLIKHESVSVAVDLGDMESLRLRLSAVDVFEESWAAVQRLASSEASTNISVQDSVNTIALQGRDTKVMINNTEVVGHVEWYDTLRCVLVLYGEELEFEDVKHYPLIVAPRFGGTHEVTLYEWDGKTTDLPKLLLG